LWRHFQAIAGVLRWLLKRTSVASLIAAQKTLQPPNPPVIRIRIRTTMLARLAAER